MSSHADAVRVVRSGAVMDGIAKEQILAASRRLDLGSDLLQGRTSYRCMRNIEQRPWCAHTRVPGH